MIALLIFNILDQQIIMHSVEIQITSSPVDKWNDIAIHI